MPEFLTEWGQKNRVSHRAGIDRGMLYMSSNASGYPNLNTYGMAWDGLVSVTESPLGGEVTPVYYDGIKFTDWRSTPDFSGVIEAFGFPDVSTYINPNGAKMATTNGGYETINGQFIQNGMVFDKQRPIFFDMSWRSFKRFSNGTQQEDVHLLYNVLAGPGEEVYGTIGEETEPALISWPITATPPENHLYDITPTAHFVIRVSELSLANRQTIERMLYGYAPPPTFAITQQPYMPAFKTITDILGIVNSPVSPQYVIP
jgi:hypothetical protein